MGLFDRIFGNKPKEKGQFEGAFRMLNGYEPRFTHFTGEIYESELVRASINALATHISKLDVKTFGAANLRFNASLHTGRTSSRHGVSSLQGRQRSITTPTPCSSRLSGTITGRSAGYSHPSRNAVKWCSSTTFRICVMNSAGDRKRRSNLSIAES